MKKLKSIASIIAACVLAMLMFAGCVTTGHSSKGESESLESYETEHMIVKPGAEGFLITIKDNVENGMVFVYTSPEDEPSPVELNLAKPGDYVFHFVERGKAYTLRHYGRDKNGSDFFDEMTCIAKGGLKFSDYFDLSKFTKSKVEGYVKSEEDSYVHFASTDIKNPSDILKKTDQVDYFHFNFAMIVGDEGSPEFLYLYGPNVFVEDLKEWNNRNHGKFNYILEDPSFLSILNWENGEFGEMLKNGFTSEAWGNPIGIETIKEHGSKYKYRINIFFKIKGHPEHREEYVMKTFIESPVYYIDAE